MQCSLCSVQRCERWQPNQTFPLIGNLCSGFTRAACVFSIFHSTVTSCTWPLPPLLVYIIYFTILQILFFVCAAGVPPPPNFGDHSFGLLIVGRLPARITARRYHISKIVQYLRRSNQIQGIYEIIPQGRQPHKRRNWNRSFGLTSSSSFNPTLHFFYVY